MATTTIHTITSGGNFVRKGVTTALDDGGTIDTGLPTVVGMILCSETADCVATFTSQAAGTATIALRTAGVAATNITVSWEAWQRPQTA